MFEVSPLRISSAPPRTRCPGVAVSPTNKAALTGPREQQMICYSSEYVANSGRTKKNFNAQNQLIKYKNSIPETQIESLFASILDIYLHSTINVCYSLQCNYIVFYIIKHCYISFVLRLLKHLIFQDKQ